MPATVLVVEDEPIIRMDIAMHLEDAGFALLEAGSVADALVHLEREPAIRVLFTDVDLVGAQTGVELAAIVARRWPDIAIIVASGQSSRLPSELPPGCMVFEKPYHNDAVEAAMRAVVAG